MRPVIEMHDLGKKYRIYKHPFDRLKETVSISRKSYHQELWALQNVSMEVRPGESVGFVGSNGAGKSTLLKIISGISQPSLGTLMVRGRISALMELGAGFHPEFTGRENIYMNCSILGMSRREIDDRLGDIIDFAELGDFIDRPIKIYSSGMFMRLGFSVAINTDPDLLLVDEILAVGDEYFQSKCFRKIKEFREKGKTIIFVSHAVNTMRGLCNRVVWLDGGRVVAQGDSIEVTDAYLNFQRGRIGKKIRQEQQAAGIEVAETAAGESPELPDSSGEELLKMPPRVGTREGEIHKVEIMDGNGQLKSVFNFGDTIVVRLHFRANGEVPQPNLGVSIWRNDNILAYGSSAFKDDTGMETLPSSGYMDYIIPESPLMNGDYEVSVGLFCPDDIHCYDFHNRLYRFQVRCKRRDEGVSYWRHSYRYVFDDGRTVIEKEADRSAPSSENR
jgi:teichoic acid transport system ATP-binding protein